MHVATLSPDSLITSSLAVAGAVFLVAPMVYRARRLRLLLCLVIPYVAACIIVLGQSTVAQPFLAGTIAILLGSIPVSFLIIAIVDMRLGLFATDTLWLVPFAIFALIALAPATFIMHFLNTPGA